MKAIVNGRVLLPEGEADGKALLFGDRIVGLVSPEEARTRAEEILDAEGRYVAPGLVDVHMHGYLGADTSDADPQGVRRMAQGVLENGVTSFLPTTMTVAWETLEQVFCQLRALKAESVRPDFSGAEILGCHAEGPFINPEKKGAQARECILPPQAERITPYADIVRLITFAPEMPGGEAFIRALKAETDIALSMGHTCANFAQATAAVALGVNHATHLFNAMPPLAHREPGTVGAALSGDVFCELIADTFHVHPGLYPMLIRAKGDRLVLITDCTRAGGMPDGEYTLGGQPIFVKGIECRLANGTIAGSVLRLNEAVRNLQRHGGIPMYQAVRCASLNAAESVGAGERKGSLTPGKDADIALMDADCQVWRTFVRGVCKFSRM